MSPDYTTAHIRVLVATTASTLKMLELHAPVSYYYQMKGLHKRLGTVRQIMPRVGLHTNACLDDHFQYILLVEWMRLKAVLRYFMMEFGTLSVMISRCFVACREIGYSNGATQGFLTTCMCTW